MKNQIRIFAATLGLLALAAVPAISATQPTAYATALTELYGSPAPYTGEMRLTVSSDGTIHGYYFPSDGASSFIPVTGGRTGNSIWFDIGDGGMYRVQGRVHDGTIVGTAFTPNNQQYTFVANPER
jgi:hypothetical protein